MKIIISGLVMNEENISDLQQQILFNYENNRKKIGDINAKLKELKEELNLLHESQRTLHTIMNKDEDLKRFI